MWKHELCAQPTFFISPHFLFYHIYSQCAQGAAVLMRLRPAVVAARKRTLFQQSNETRKENQPPGPDYRPPSRHVVEHGFVAHLAQAHFHYGG